MHLRAGLSGRTDPAMACFTKGGSFWTNVSSELLALPPEIQRKAEELRVVNEELTRFNRAMVDRELRMVELKKEINALCAQLDCPPRYEVGFAREGPAAAG